jgi:hypothetical protein
MRKSGTLHPVSLSAFAVLTVTPTEKEDTYGARHETGEMG